MFGIIIDVILVAVGIILLVVDINIAQGDDKRYNKVIEDLFLLQWRFEVQKIEIEKLKKEIDSIKRQEE